MDVSGLLIELFGRIDGHVDEIVDGLDPSSLRETLVPGTNPIGWLVWHLTRVQDMHVAEILEEDQLWVTGDWAPRFGVEPEPHNVGYGHRPEEVAAIRPDGIEALVDYHRAVAARTRALLVRTTPDDLDRVVDERWDPPVTLGVRLVSIADDDLQHAGQALYLKGQLRRR